MTTRDVVNRRTHHPFPFSVLYPPRSSTTGVSRPPTYYVECWFPGTVVPRILHDPTNPRTSNAKKLGFPLKDLQTTPSRDFGNYLVRSRSTRGSPPTLSIPRSTSDHPDLDPWLPPQPLLFVQPNKVPSDPTESGNCLPYGCRSSPTKVEFRVPSFHSNLSFKSATVRTGRVVTQCAPCVSICVPLPIRPPHCPDSHLTLCPFTLSTVRLDCCVEIRRNGRNVGTVRVGEPRSDNTRHVTLPSRTGIPSQDFYFTLLYFLRGGVGHPTGGTFSVYYCSQPLLHFFNLGVCDNNTHIVPVGETFRQTLKEFFNLHVKVRVVKVTIQV